MSASLSNSFTERDALPSKGEDDQTDYLHIFPPYKGEKGGCFLKNFHGKSDFWLWGNKFST
jgi:hypothetical protein